MRCLHQLLGVDVSVIAILADLILPLRVLEEWSDVHLVRRHVQLPPTSRPADVAPDDVADHWVARHYGSEIGR